MEMCTWSQLYSLSAAILESILHQISRPVHHIWRRCRHLYSVSPLMAFLVVFRVILMFAHLPISSIWKKDDFNYSILVMH